jgi:hypothetical protein
MQSGRERRVNSESASTNSAVIGKTVAKQSVDG